MPRPKKYSRLSHKDMRQINLFVDQARYTRAVKILKRAMPVYELLEQFRQMSCERAHAARDAGNWQAVLRHLDAYAELIKQQRAACLQESNLEPPALSPEDQSLLDRARDRVAG